VSDLDAWLTSYQERMGNKSESVRRNVQKTLRKFLRLAREEGVKFTWPFVAGSSVREVAPPRVWLTAEEVKRLRSLNIEELADTQQRALLVFLVQCFTGLRVSDAQALKADNVQDRVLVVVPKKTATTTGRETRIAISQALDQVLELAAGWSERERMVGRDVRLLPAITEQQINRQLKRLAKMAGIKKHITTHVGRHTFATLFLDRGGSIEVLRELLGHRSLTTTLVYTHITQRRAQDQVLAALEGM
jgi:site-specific recombinase XerD